MQIAFKQGTYFQVGRVIRFWVVNQGINELLPRHLAAHARVRRSTACLLQSRMSRDVVACINIKPGLSGDR